MLNTSFLWRTSSHNCRQDKNNASKIFSPVTAKHSNVSIETKYIDLENVNCIMRLIRCAQFQKRHLVQYAQKRQLFCIPVFFVLTLFCRHTVQSKLLCHIPPNKTIIHDVMQKYARLFLLIFLTQ